MVKEEEKNRCREEEGNGGIGERYGKEENIVEEDILRRRRKEMVGI